MTSTTAADDPAARQLRDALADSLVAGGWITSEHVEMRALETAERIHAKLSGSALAGSAFGYAESQLRFHAGDVLARLGDTTAARAELDRALALCPSEDYTDWALIRLDRAACMIGDGEADAALPKPLMPCWRSTVPGGRASSPAGAASCSQRSPSRTGHQGPPASSAPCSMTPRE